MEDDFQLKLARKTREYISFLVYKNTNYGNSIFKTSVITGHTPLEKCMDHIEEKIERIFQSKKIESNKLLEEESFWDSLRDLVGYILIAEILHDEEKYNETSGNSKSENVD